MEFTKERKLKRSFVVQIFSLTSSLRKLQFSNLVTTQQFQIFPTKTFAPTEMDYYSLVIDISSDEERTSTPIKTLPVNMVGKLNISDSSLEVWRSSDADLNSTFESDCSARKPEPTPKKQKFTRVSFKLPPVSNGTESDYYEEPDTPQRPRPLRPCRKINVQSEGEKPGSSLNDLDKSPAATKTVQEYMEELISPDMNEYLAKLELDMGNEAKKEAYLTAGRGRGPNQVRNYVSRLSVLIKKKIPYCHGLPLSLASRGALSRPAPGRNFT